MPPYPVAIITALRLSLRWRHAVFVEDASSFRVRADTRRSCSRGRGLFRVDTRTGRRPGRVDNLCFLPLLCNGVGCRRRTFLTTAPKSPVAVRRRTAGLALAGGALRDPTRRLDVDRLVPERVRAFLRMELHLLRYRYGWFPCCVVLLAVGSIVAGM